MPFIAFNKKVVKNPEEGKTFLVKHQMYLFLLADSFLTLLWHSMYRHPRYVLQHGYHLQFASILFHYYLAYQIGFWPWAISTWVVAAYLFGNFSLSHTHLPVTTDATHWVEYSLVHTADIQPTWWCDWWMGYLNYQIEHHFFPTMPQFRHPLIHERVKALAKKHNLPFHVFSYVEACKKTLGNLKNVAEELQKA